MIVTVEVGVALRRPPQTDRISKVRVAVPDPLPDADLVHQLQILTNLGRLLAVYMCQVRPEVVMCTSAEVTEIEDDP